MVPSQWLYQRYQLWWQTHHIRSDTPLLTQRNVFILPTRAGLMFAVVVFILLIASINYQLSLGYVLTFLLAGSAAASMQRTHGTLRGLTLHMKPVTAVFAGDAVALEVVLASPNHARYGVGLKISSAHVSTLSWVDVPAASQITAHVSFIAAHRGQYDVPALSVETRFPLGLFRAWTVWRPLRQVVVYPRPESPIVAIPESWMGANHSSDMRQVQRVRNLMHGNEIDGVRSYRRGDSLKLVCWKKTAQTIGTSGELVSRDTHPEMQSELWLDWLACGTLSLEQRLSRLTAWVLASEQANINYGLKLPGVVVPCSIGQAHRHHCLEALALWG